LGGGRLSGYSDQEWAWHVGAVSRTYSPAVVPERRVPQGYFTPMSQRRRLTCEGVEGESKRIADATLDEGIQLSGAQNDETSCAGVVVSKEASVAVDFEPGFCYGSAVKAEFRESAFSKLGPDPALLQLLRSPVLWFDVDSVENRIQCQRAGDGSWHVSEEGNVSLGVLLASVASSIGVFSSQHLGAYVLSEFVLGPPFDLSCVSREHDTLGAGEDSGGVVRLVEDEVQVEDRKRLRGVKRALSDLVAPYRLVSTVMLWVTESVGFAVQAPLKIQESVVLELEPTDSRASAYAFAVEVPGRAIVKPPIGWKVAVGDTLVGSSSVTTWFGFRGKCHVLLIAPPDHVGSVELELVIGKRVDWALDVLLGPRSTDARFVREVSFPVILRWPSAMQNTFVGAELDSVQISDPLDSWAAVDEVRLSSDKVGQAFAVEGGGLFAYGAFRCENSAELMLGGIARLTSSDAGVVIDANAGLEVVGPEGDICCGSSRWSVRRRCCRDEYCMDGGGPSDSDFSDAV